MSQNSLSELDKILDNFAAHLTQAKQVEDASFDTVTFDNGQLWRNKGRDEARAAIQAQLDEVIASTITAAAKACNVSEYWLKFQLTTQSKSKEAEQ